VLGGELVALREKLKQVISDAAADESDSALAAYLAFVVSVSVAILTFVATNFVLLVALSYVTSLPLKAIPPAVYPTEAVHSPEVMLTSLYTCVS
jgi:hypothetical protein